ncbi:FixH family protein [Ramlibacter rhizophilus]|uniref:Nitrogen fixation protein FixH n=1 Tax=Ramlibacter rhizophilus TaxID=1781167 RepID=A0A4Z0BDZ2_9BURK|nr:FixH family protein [Ramlibacter rhizophilus]TFY96537.1 nitrogen fixation protein FixH [Ramlibacter rhizophilus]
MTLPSSPPESRSAAPWWHHGHVWLVIAGPVTVILAGIATVVIAVRQPDPLVAEDYYRRGIEINKTLAEEGAKALLPALQGRNHAASPAPAR